VDRPQAPPGLIQRKLVIGEVDDPLEHEADRIAEQVIRSPAPALSISAVRPQLSRKCDACQEEEAQTLQMKPIAPKAAAREVPSIVNDVLGSPGQSLDPGMRTFMEPRFGFDFANVRVHADREADRSAKAVGARAYTFGRHIVFAAGEYGTNSQRARRLLAHEMTHVVQQAASPMPHVQRDTGGQKKPAADPQQSKEDAPERKAAMAQVSEIEHGWLRVKTIADGFAETKGWIDKGNEVVALIREHTTRSLDAIAAGDTELVNDYKFLLESDLVAYRYVVWHAFVYQNLARLRPEVDSLVSSLDADKTDFTGRKEAEDLARDLKRLTDSLGRDSAASLSPLITNHPIKVRAGTTREVTITVTSAADKDKEAALEGETQQIIDVQMATQVILEHVNAFLRNATREGFWNAMEAVKEFYEVRKGILDSNGGPNYDDSKKEGSRKSDEPQRGGGGRWGCDDVRCNVYPDPQADPPNKNCPARVIGASRGHPSYYEACLAAEKDANRKVPRGCIKRHCNCTTKCRKM